MTGEVERFLQVKNKLNKTSCSFCLAKWLQTTLHLQNGRTHSCHHPLPHKIPESEIEKDPSALHNTEYKKLQRKKMLEGEKPSECQYCWNIEDLNASSSTELISDRYIKSSEKWAFNRLEDIAAMPWDQNVNPTYVEVSFSNLCNFKCSYCSPVYSSQWVAEAKKYGGYPTSSDYNDLEYFEDTDQLPYEKNEHNPYIEAFWKYWPTMIKSLKVFRITGGEPLIDPNTFKVLDYLIENPKPKLEISVNTNACIPDDNLDMFIEKMKNLTANEKVGLTRVYTSVDTHGKQAEYIRHGLNYDKWISNVDRILTELPTTKLTVMCTTNLMSMFSFKKLLEDVYKLKMKHFNEDRKVPITIDISIMRWPGHQTAAILPRKYADQYMVPALEYMKEKQEGTNGNDYYKGFFDFEIAKLERFIEYARNDPNDAEALQLSTARADFYRFVNEHDRRRGTHFLDTFPELKDFYELCRDEDDRRIIY